MALAAFGALAGGARDARADANDAKGTLGGAMLGAEVVMLTESAFRLRPGWMYLAGGAGGGLVGGYLGYRISHDSSNRPPSFLLAGGIALIIPAIMGVLTATHYEPIGALRQDGSDAESSDEVDIHDAEDDDGGPGDFESSEPPRARDGAEPEQAGDGRAFAARLELPSIELAQAFSRDELARHRVHQVTELHVSVLRGVF